jgi:hypothetical protein
VSKRHQALRRRPPAAFRSVPHDECLGARGTDTKSKAANFVVPNDDPVAPRSKSLDVSLCELHETPCGGHHRVTTETETQGTTKKARTQLTL